MWQSVCACNYPFASTIRDPMSIGFLPIANTNKARVEPAVSTDSLKCYTPLKMTVLYQYILQKNPSEQGHWLFQYVLIPRVPLTPTHVLEDSSILILLLKHPQRLISAIRSSKPQHTPYQSSRYVWMKSLRSVPSWVTLSLRSSSMGIRLEILTLGNPSKLYFNMECYLETKNY